MHRNDNYDDILDQISHWSSYLTFQRLSRSNSGGNATDRVDQSSDETPFLVGLTNKCLLRNATRDPTSFEFHIDGTFKLNQDIQ
ncbi:LOW QUALITY PROTEIN: hypothetical protein PHMEG_00025584 [Phytophthora megakarya]|uniref:Uncharacterized protein n=1 Tax=Phytophthora megakarya TaxID=4795 RepID=A0A225VBT7_9STRA|nr:LOW QUALITY PROTEIN: hypothetical protein PHMEG_00025584 [Phytophthora megakarya]